MSMYVCACMYSKLGLSKVSMVHLEWAMDKVSMGSERRSAVISEENRKLTAYHEGMSVCEWGKCVCVCGCACVRGGHTHVPMQHGYTYMKSLTHSLTHSPPPRSQLTLSTSQSLEMTIHRSRPCDCDCDSLCSFASGYLHDTRV